MPGMRGVPSPERKMLVFSRRISICSMTSMPFCFRPSGQSVRVMPVSVMLISLTRVDLLRVRRTIPRTCGGDVSCSEGDVASCASFSDGDTWLCACKKTAGSVTASAPLYPR